MRNEVVSNVSRLDVLSREGSAMGDDEVNLHAHACMLLANNPNLEFLDPLMASTWLKVGNGDQVQEWLAMTPDVNCIATVVHWNDHWSPVVWKKGITEVQVSMWEHEDVDVSALYPLHGLISVAWGMPMFAVACSRRSYAKSHCGAAAVAFLAHMLIDAALPQTEEEMLAFHKALRDRFTAAVHNLYHVPKPWCWGLGTPDVLSITASLLHLHGVPQTPCPVQSQIGGPELRSKRSAKSCHRSFTLEIIEVAGKPAVTAIAVDHARRSGTEGNCQAIYQTCQKHCDKVVCPGPSS